MKTARKKIDIAVKFYYNKVYGKGSSRHEREKTRSLGAVNGAGAGRIYDRKHVSAHVLPGRKNGAFQYLFPVRSRPYGLPEALLVVVARTVLGSLFAGNFSLLLYSLTAGVVSTTVSRLLLLAFPRVSLLCVSVFSAVVHNTVQLLVYCALTQTTLIFSYLPYLALLGVLAGVIVGLAVTYAVKGIPLSFFARTAGVNKKNPKTEELEIESEER